MNESIVSGNVYDHKEIARKALIRAEEIRKGWGLIIDPAKLDSATAIVCSVCSKQLNAMKTPRACNCN